LALIFREQDTLPIDDDRFGSASDFCHDWIPELNCSMEQFYEIGKRGDASRLTPLRRGRTRSHGPQPMGFSVDLAALHLSAIQQGDRGPVVRCTTYL
jgi:hypothetical protein